MSSITTLTAVMAGGALGGMLRALATRAGARLWGNALPWGTLAANYAAALALGAFAGAVARGGELGLAWAFAATGVLGGLSTVSSLALQTLGLWQQPRRGAAIAYLALSVIGGVALAAVGHALTAVGGSG
ncbi:CrcB family protein [Halomonas piscis]|uniref:Fluoride-specific ion channel FluC n=1 Tax=Halomonas piscis TaxID=3031727 RepID=A0ABY9Z1B5_9GAMM|nr:CrcB family protein [Halomonas piscis]WNK20395.1 CrcB family protein [Halomonas piscis]